MINLLLLLLSTYLFFSYALLKFKFIFPFTILGIFIIFILKRFKKNIYLKKEDYFWILCSLANIVGVLNSTNISEAINFVFIMLLLCILKISLNNLNNWRRRLFVFFTTLSIIHVLSTLIQFINPKFIDKINKIILSEYMYVINFQQLNWMKKYPGITGQITANAWYISIFLAMIFSLIIIKKNDLKNYKMVYRFLFVLSFIALLLTQKRGLILFNILTIFSIFIINNYYKLSKKNKFIFLIVIIFFIIFFIFSLSITFKIPYFFKEDITSGRIDIYKSVFEMIKEYPFIGNGIGSVEYKLGIEAHNIYIQLWSELGFFGMIIYISAIVKTLFSSIDCYFYSKNNKNTNMEFYSLISLYVQIMFIFYGFTGNPLYDYFMLSVYFLFISFPNKNLEFK